jgi:lipopolysaccharide/colanic/teichoic acid biosynthesis glycosyltransferase
MSTVFRTKRSVPSRQKEAIRAVVVAEQVEPSAYFRWNFVVHRLLGAILLVVAVPAIALCLLAVYLTSRGAPLYRQKRVGKGGRVFTIYKIRTMRIDAEAGTGPVWTTSTRDPRITPVGRFLRCTHLDELPQLVNVLTGQMALVGPRPERPEFAQALAEEIPNYLDRLLVLPGVTGLAQVNLPADSDFDSVRRKLLLDLRYIAQASFLLDIRLLIATAAPLVGIRANLINRLLRVSCTAEIPRITAEPVERANGKLELSDKHAEFISTMCISQ